MGLTFPLGEERFEIKTEQFIVDLDNDTVLLHGCVIKEMSFQFSLIAGGPFHTLLSSSQKVGQNSFSEQISKD